MSDKKPTPPAPKPPPPARPNPAPAYDGIREKVEKGQNDVPMQPRRPNK